MLTLFLFGLVCWVGWKATVFTFRLGWGILKVVMSLALLLMIPIVTLVFTGMLILPWIWPVILLALVIRFIVRSTGTSILS